MRQIETFLTYPALIRLLSICSALIVPIALILTVPTRSHQMRTSDFVALVEVLGVNIAGTPLGPWSWEERATVRIIYLIKGDKSTREIVTPPSWTIQPTRLITHSTLISNNRIGDAVGPPHKPIVITARKYKNRLVYSGLLKNSYPNPGQQRNAIWLCAPSPSLGQAFIWTAAVTALLVGLLTRSIRTTAIYALSIAPFILMFYIMYDMYADVDFTAERTTKTDPPSGIPFWVTVICWPVVLSMLLSTRDLFHVNRALTPLIALLFICQLLVLLSFASPKCL
jgi:hypothetical protein